MERWMPLVRQGNCPLDASLAAAPERTKKRLSMTGPFWSDYSL